jgi:hypothetical protein
MVGIRFEQKIFGRRENLCRLSRPVAAKRADVSGGSRVGVPLCE